MELHQWFEVGIRYMKTMDNGAEKRVTELYLVDSLSFTEGEERSIGELSAYISGEFEVKTMRKMNISEIFESDCKDDDKYYKAKLAFIALDEKSGAEKKTFSNVIVQASDLRNAIRNLDDGMKGTMADYNIVSVAETKIVDIYKYKPEKK